MRTLILMRHAKSDWKQPGLSDHDRPLNRRGRRTAPMVAEHLNALSLKPSVILASTAVRVQETIQILQETWVSDAETLSEKSLYLAPPNEIAAQVTALHDSWETAMVVGHNPGMCSLVCNLAGRDLEMPTAAVAIFQADVDSWADSFVSRRWQLQEFLLPRDLESSS